MMVRYLQEIHPLSTWQCSDYEVHRYDREEVPPYLYAFAPYLYATRRHLRTQVADHPFCLFYLVEKAKQVVVALVHCTYEGDMAYSPVRAPVGGLQGSLSLPDEGWRFLLDCVEAWARSQQIQSLTLTTAPTAYAPTLTQKLDGLYAQQGYQMGQEYLSHHIPVKAPELVGQFAPAERRRLRKCRRAGFQAERWENPDVALVYDFIVSSRRAKGYLFSMSEEALKALLCQLPQEVLVFTVRDTGTQDGGTRYGGTLVALTVAIRVSATILYNFCPADHPDYRTYSPTVMLTEALYRYAWQQGMTLLDLGTSTDHLGAPKPGLIRFKERLGGVASSKKTYWKELR